jgi:pyruvate,water dikinase
MSTLLRRTLNLFRPWRKEAALRSSAAFRLQYERFRQLLALNDRMLQLFADIENQLSASAPFALESTLRRIREASVDVFVMAKNLNQITNGRFPELYDALAAVSDQLDAELQRLRGATPGPLVVPVSGLRAADAALAGAKMANLGEVTAGCGLAVPEGFAITTAAFGRFMEENWLWDRCERLAGLLEANGPSALNEGCAEVRSAMLGAVVPADVAEAVAAACAAAFSDEEALLAVRSSAVGEDGSATSHAGIYHSELHVPRERLLNSYREVVASAFTPAAVSYRYARGLTTAESSMAVGCIRMVDAMASGIMFSRPPESPAEDLVVISGSRGIAAGIALGTEDASIWTGPPGGPFAGGDASVGDADLRRLAQTARQLEEHFGSAQDVEWAIDASGQVIVLQTRPMVTIAPGAPQESSPLDELELLAEGGLTACPGVAAGPVVPVRGEADLADFPDGGVLLAHHSSPVFTQVMTRCAAIVTEVGSPTGHMAILAREYGVPAIVGMTNAGRALIPGAMVTVDARNRRVLAGAPARLLEGALRQERPDSPAIRGLRAIAQLVTPLHLTNPASPDFAPQACRTLHDMTRFVHEKAFEGMFHFGDAAATDRLNSWRLEAPLPIDIRVFDVGGGVAADAPTSGRISPRDILSVPMLAFLEGMLDGRISWREPRPVSVKGFLSVLGESMASPPPDAQQLGRLSYAIVSDRYLNFSTKAGYHFSTIDTYCGRSANKNYIHFRFSGGAADELRRRRRLRFILRVLESLDFRVNAGGDILHARLDKYEPEVIRQRLADLGRLTLCARQLDMLMGSEDSPERFAQDFLSGRFEFF